MEQETLLEKYRVELDTAGMPVELRRDATGVTCRAHEIETGREVALQIMPAPDLDAEVREKIEADAVAAKQLNHVNIPKLYDFGFHGNDLVYVTEYFDGTTAESWVTTHGPMPVRAVLHVALQVVSALGAAAFHLITHRAIHPGNLLIVPGQAAEGDWPTIKVLNFGRIAPKLAAARRRNGGVDKSAPFASPEQVEIGRVDFRSEIFSLGCTLWSLLTGVPPFNAAGKPLAGAQMTAAMKRFRGVPKKIRRLITEMAATNPDDRPLDPVVMTDQLQDCLVSVERWEAIARKVGIPATWQRRRVAKPVGPLAARPLAMAAVVLIISALAALALTKNSQVNSLWRKFAYQKPIGIPIGVPDASVTPAANGGNDVATPVDATTAASEADLIKNLNRTKSTGSDANASPLIASASPTASPTSPVVVSSNENIAVTSQSPSPNESPTPISAAPVAETATDVSNQHESMPQIASTHENSATPPPAPSTSPNEQKSDENTALVTESAATAAPITAQTDRVPRAELIELPPSKSTASGEIQSDASGQAIVPRAELVEPPSPAEGPANSAPNAPTSEESAPSAEKMEGVPRAELIETPMAASSRSPRRKRTPLSAPLTPSERAVIRNAASRPLLRAEGDGAMVQTPDGIVHARFVGKTADGQWMLALPSRKIMIVPPPSEFAPR